MTDISKCHGKDCPLKNSCYRFTAQGDPYWQAWMDERYRDGECDYYVETEANK